MKETFAAGLDLYQLKDGKVIRILVVGFKREDGSIFIWRRIQSVLPEWPKGIE